jgi:hypothetical protein
MRIVGLLTGLALFGADIKDASFISGCWAMRAADGTVIEEMWNKPTGGTMNGVGRTVSGGKTRFNEYLEIREENGVLTYYAQLRLGGPVTPFPAIKVVAGELVFANPQHDYPQRIIYRRTADGGLFARVEGNQKGKAASEDFPYKRVKCD